MNTARYGLSCARVHDSQEIMFPPAPRETCDSLGLNWWPAGERLVQKELRRTLLKYKLHTDQELFDKAYGYIRQYY